MRLHILLLCAFISLSVYGQDVVINNAILSDGGVTPRTDAQKSATTTVSSILKNIGLDPYSAVASTNMDQGDVWYRLFNDMKIHAVDISTKQYLGGWKLFSYPEAMKMAGEARHAFTLSDYKVIDNAAALALDAGRQYRFGNYKGDVDSLYGCLTKYPMRYSDIELDGQRELLLVLGEDLVIFSVAGKKVIFSASMHQNDELDEIKVDAFMQHEGYEESGNTPQFLSDSAASIELGEVAPAWRAFAKLYFSDFDTDGAFDIVVWRKLYESRLQADPVNGFIKKGDLLVHYKLLNGEYKKQETDQATIKGWLTANQLTWQKGYPSKSECPGQEGQLIPEMHDLLLNDPEVLQ